MTPNEAAEAIASLRALAPAAKEFDGPAAWIVRTDRPTPSLELSVSLRIDGILRGARVRLKTPQPSWEADVYGHIEVTVSRHHGFLRLAPIEWRPQRAHTNSASAPAEYRLLSFLDRWHPPELNYERGIAAFAQDVPGVAAPLPRAIATFEEYLGLCADLWNCPDMARVPPPPWTQEFRL